MPCSKSGGGGGGWGMGDGAVLHSKTPDHECCCSSPPHDKEPAMK